MKNLFTVKKSLFTILIIVLIFASSCKSKKDIKPPVTKDESQQEINIVFNESKYKSDSTFYRASGSYNSLNMEDARLWAQMVARQKLATEIRTNLDGAMNKYGQSSDINRIKNFDEEARNDWWIYVNEEIKGSTILDEKVFKEADNSYTAYAVAQIKISSLFNNYSKDKENFKNDRDQFKQDKDQQKK